MSWVSASSMIAAALPWPHSVYRSEKSAHLVIRDLRHNLTLEISYRELATAPEAAKYIFGVLDHYRTLLAIWQGSHRVVWA